MSSPSTVFDHLERFGLCETEARIYYFLVHNPSQSILKISRELGVPRTSIYDNSQKLIEKGLLERVQKNNSQRLRALPPTVFEKSLHKQQTVIKDLEESFEILKHSLSPKPDPELEYQLNSLFGTEGLKTILDKSLSSKYIYLIDNFNIQSYSSETYFDNWLKSIRKKNIELKHIINSDTEALIKAQKHIKILKKINQEEVRVVSSSNLTLNIIQIISSTSQASFSIKEENCLGTEIINPYFVKASSQIFTRLWVGADPVSKFFT